jgi:hypothetical protein
MYKFKTGGQNKRSQSERLLFRKTLVDKIDGFPESIQG